MVRHYQSLSRSKHQAECTALIAPRLSNPGQCLSLLAVKKTPAPQPAREWRHGDYLLTDDVRRLDFDAVCAMLHSTYWANDRPRSVIEKSIRHSVCFSLLHEGKQVGFIRGVTDHATFTWLCDVVVHPDHRGKGLGKWMVQCFLEHPELQTISHHLCTKDAHALYEEFGFKRIEAMRRSDRPMLFLFT
jgi:GNAT superfamily N-acetyltransferase